jgi:hypothetical protein
MPTALKSTSKLGSELATEKAIPFPERIRPDRNLEKWPIWQPAHSKNKNARTFTRVIVGTDGEQRIQQVKVDYSALSGTLTTEDQKVFYALVKIWEETGRSTEASYFSLQQIARILKKKWGSYAIATITQSLTGLRTIGIIWVDSYFDNAQKSTKSNNSTLIPFTILSKLKVVSRKQDGHITKAGGYFRFDDDILNNLLTNYTKPVLFDVVINLKSEIAQILYTHLDLILADKTMFERRTNELFSDLGIVGKEYYKPSGRKRILEKALIELTGVPLTTGRIASATLEETADGKDYKIVIRKGKLIAVPKINHYQEEQSPEMGGAQVLAESKEVSSAGQPLRPQKPHNDELLNQARELVTYFYQVFHTDKNFQITSKALGQAISLITKHGVEQSNYIVDYAHREAPKTHFDIQAFGGVMQYSSRALADFERRRIQQEEAARYRAEHEARLAEEIEQQRREQATKQRAQAYLDQLPPEQSKALFDECAAQYKASDFYRAHYDTITVQSAIRTLVLKRIIAEQGMNADNETTRETTPPVSNEPLDTGTDQPIG